MHSTKPTKTRIILRSLLLCLLRVFVVTLLGLVTSAGAAEKKIVLIAGGPSHGSGEHEFQAGCLLLKKCLDHVHGVNAVVYTNGWPKDSTAFDGAAAVFIYCDGGGGHPVIRDDRLQKLKEVIKESLRLG